MGQYLKDQAVQNITITEDTLRALNLCLTQQMHLYHQQQLLYQQLVQQPAAAAAPANAPAQVQAQPAAAPAAPAIPAIPPDKQLFLSYVIRYDNTGNRLHSFEEFLAQYRSATKIERILFTIENSESLRTNRAIGTCFEIRCDCVNIEDNNNYMLVTGETAQWVDAAHGAATEIIRKAKNRHGFIRNPWTFMLIQIMGIVLAFIVSIWGARLLAPNLAIENALIFSFLFILFIFSNIWGYLFNLLPRALNIAFPNVKFEQRRKRSLQWLGQAIVGGIVVAIVLFLLQQMFSYLGTMIATFLTKS